MLFKNKNIRYLLFLSLFNISIDYGKEKNNNKKINIHSMKNIDFIYMINLDHRPDKFKKASEKLKKYNIIPYRVSAINGSFFSAEYINSLGVQTSSDMFTLGLRGNIFFANSNKKLVCKTVTINCDKNTYFSSIMTPGAFGCLLTHLSVLRDAFNKNYETIWVIEDDIDIIRNPHGLSDLIDEINSTIGENMWDILYTDRDTRDKYGKYCPPKMIEKRPDVKITNEKMYLLRQKINNHIIEIKARYGTYSMIIKRSGIIKILDFFEKHKIFSPYDNEIHIIPHLKIFVPTKDIVAHDLKRTSDIVNFKIS